jgi:hypothetical protein
LGGCIEEVFGIGLIKSLLGSFTINKLVFEVNYHFPETLWLKLCELSFGRYLLNIPLLVNFERKK